MHEPEFDQKLSQPKYEKVKTMVQRFMDQKSEPEILRPAMKGLKQEYG